MAFVYVALKFYILRIAVCMRYIYFFKSFIRIFIQITFLGVYNKQLRGRLLQKSKAPAAGTAGSGR